MTPKTSLSTPSAVDLTQAQVARTGQTKGRAMCLPFSHGRLLDIFAVLGQMTRQVFGAVAQLGERVVRNDEVVGSIPICSTIIHEINGLE